MSDCGGPRRQRGRSRARGVVVADFGFTTEVTSRDAVSVTADVAKLLDNDGLPKSAMQFDSDRKCLFDGFNNV